MTNQILRCIILLIPLINLIQACDHCVDNELTSEGGFADFYPIYLGNWILDAELYDGNPFFTCPWDCHGRRGFFVGFSFIGAAHKRRHQSWGEGGLSKDDLT